MRSGTSIGANYREANRAESKLDFHKVGIAEKEASETAYWLEICEAASLGNAEEIRGLLKESREILAIVTTIGRKSKGRNPRIANTVVTTVVLAASLFPLSRLSLSAFL